MPLAGTLARAETTYSSDYKYYDGATAHAEAVCATADLCGTIALRSGDVVTIYAETTAGCGAPTLHIYRRRGAQNVLNYQLTPALTSAHRQSSENSSATPSGCRGATAYVSFDRGRIRMAIFPLASGGQLFVRFAAGVSAERTNAAPAFTKAL